MADHTSALNLLPANDLLTTEEVQRLTEHSNIVSYDKGEVIIRQNTRTSHVMLIVEGLVKTFRVGRSNKTLILNLGKPGQFIGLLSIFGQAIYQYSSSAISASQILIIDREAFQQVVTTNGDFAWRLVELISQMGLSVSERFHDYYQKQLPGKVADVLLFFAEELYQATSFTLPLTRRELAELAGTTKESFIRTLTEFKNDRIISLDGKQVDIASIKILKKLSQFG